MSIGRGAAGDEPLPPRARSRDASPLDADPEEVVGEGFDATIARPSRRVIVDDATMVRPSRRRVADEATALGSRRVAQPRVVVVGEPDGSPEPHADSVKRRTAYSPHATRLRAIPPHASAPQASAAPQASSTPQALMAPQPSPAAAPVMTRRTRRAGGHALVEGGVVAALERPVDSAVIQRAIRTTAQRRAVVLAVAAGGVVIAAVCLLVVLLQTWH